MEISLGRRLKELRDAQGLTQRAVAEELGGERPLSPALISSWESGKAVPSDRWLARYAQVFGARSAGPNDAGGADELLAALSELRRVTTPSGTGYLPLEAEVGPLGGRFWHFPDRQQVRILGTPMYERVIGDLEYADPRHPNYIESLRNADMDATLELFGHLRAENPSCDVRVLTHDRVSRDSLTGHVVLLGGADMLRTSVTQPSPLYWFIRRLELPIETHLPEGGDEEYDTEFVVTVDESGAPAYRGSRQEAFRPTFLREGSARLLVDGLPQLEYEVGLFARMPNPMNLSATVTICSGIFSRGTFGVVRALTDVNLRERNEEFLDTNVDRTDFWMLLRIPIFQTPVASETITPDLFREFHILRQP